MLALHENMMNKTVEHNETTQKMRYNVLMPLQNNGSVLLCKCINYCKWYIGVLKVCFHICSPEFDTFQVIYMKMEDMRHSNMVVQ